MDNYILHKSFGFGAISENVARVLTVNFKNPKDKLNGISTKKLMYDLSSRFYTFINEKDIKSLYALVYSKASSIDKNDLTIMENSQVYKEFFFDSFHGILSCIHFNDASQKLLVNLKTGEFKVMTKTSVDQDFLINNFALFLYCQLQFIMDCINAKERQDEQAREANKRVIYGYFNNPNDFNDFIELHDVLYDAKKSHNLEKYFYPLKNEDNYSLSLVLNYLDILASILSNNLKLVERYIDKLDESGIKKELLNELKKIKISNPFKFVSYNIEAESSPTFLFIDRYFKDDPKRAFTYFSENIEFFNDKRAYQIFELLSNELYRNDGLFISFINKIFKNRKLTLDEKKRFIPLVTKANPFVAAKAMDNIPQLLYEYFSIDFLCKILPYLTIYRKVLKIICDKIDDLQDDKKFDVGVALLRFMYSNFVISNTLEMPDEIAQIYEKLPKDWVFAELYAELHAHSMMDIADFNLPFKERFKEFVINNFEADNVLELGENFYKYFSLCFEVTSSNMDDLETYEFNVKYFLNDKHGDPLFDFMYEFNTDSDPARQLYISTDVPISLKNQYIFFSLMKEAHKKDPKEFEYLEECRNHLINFENNILDKKLINTFNEIEKRNVENITKKLAKNAEIKIELVLEEKVAEYGYYFGIKVGNVRMYKVKSVYNFVKAFETGSFDNYGVNFGFYHTRENIAPEYRDMLDSIILFGDLKTLHGPRFFVIPKEKFNAFMKKMKGQIIYYKQIPYINTMEEIDIDVSLNEDYVLNINDNLNGKTFIRNFNQYYCFDRENGIIRTTCDNSKVELIEFAKEFDGQSLQRVKDKFLEKVYPVFEKDIYIDEKIKKDFKISHVIIKSYFDIDEGTNISLKTKYFRNDNEIDAKDINTTSDLIKKNNYENIMSSLGFNEFGILSDNAKILQFLGLDFSEIQKISEVYLSEELSNKKVMKFQAPVVKMTFNNNMMSVFFKESQYSDDELYAILNAIKKKKKYVLLKDNRILTFDEEKSKEFLGLIESLKLDKKHLNEIEERPLYQSFAAFNHVDLIEIDDKLQEIVDTIKNFKKAKIALPKVDADLRKYQVEGFKWLKILTQYGLGGILADDMGLGKTLEIITLLASDETKEPSLIVAPKSLVFNWYSEFTRFYPSMKIKMIYGSADDRANIIKNIKKDCRVVYLTSYDSLRNDVKNYTMEFNYLVLDEAQVIKNIHALKTQTTKQINAKHRFALTGTPIENNIYDLWSIFDFLMPRYLPSLNTMKDRNSDEDFQNMIARRAAPFILRRTKKEVLKDLPQKFERVLTAEMTSEQRKLYDAECLKANDILANKGKAFDVLYILTRLRQICVDPRTYIENYTGKSGKTEMLKSLIKEYIENDHRILIFSQFVSALDIIEKYLIDEKIQYFEITGKTNAKDRVDLVEEFNHNTNIKVFLISLKAGGNGLNLVGADTVIHYDPWWNVAAENQATDRAYRIGQKRNVEVIRLIASDSIEQRVIELQNKKKDLIDKLISNDTSSIEKISIEDLKFILN